MRWRESVSVSVRQVPAVPPSLLAACVHVGFPSASDTTGTLSTIRDETDTPDGHARQSRCVICAGSTMPPLAGLSVCPPPARTVALAMVMDTAWHGMASPRDSFSDTRRAAAAAVLPGRQGRARHRVQDARGNCGPGSGCWFRGERASGKSGNEWDPVGAGCLSPADWPPTSF